MPFKKLLVANRGEIAVRVIRTCRELGIETLAVYSAADRECAHVRLADRAVCIGPPSATASYLNQAVLMTLARWAGADAIHPGYGFLAENADFAALCAAQGIAWVGPPAEVIRSMGDKAQARQTAQRAGVPVIPGSDGPLAGEQAAHALARELGYPVLLKAVAGGGGRGMRRVDDAAAMDASFQQAEAEARAAFGDGSLYLEKYLPRVRHVEVQILGDGQGNVLHLGERDCTLQRRHQKLVEESPAPLPPPVRSELTAAAVRLGSYMGYRGAGTVEFVYDVALQRFYFIEVNCRIQVEHPVTEMLTGIDIVAAQIQVAAGEPLALAQNDIRLQGHAIECRINAEDPDRGFLPSPGRLTAFALPGGPGVRVDTHAYAGYTVPPYYDSLLAKLVVVAPDRHQAVARLLRALDECAVGGVATTIPLLRQACTHPDFQSGAIHTRWIEETLLGGGGPLGPGRPETHL